MVLWNLHLKKKIKLEVIKKKKKKVRTCTKNLQSKLLDTQVPQRKKSNFNIISLFEELQVPVDPKLSTLKTRQSGISFNLKK